MRVLQSVLCAGICLSSSLACAETNWALVARGGTLGVGGDLDVGVTQKLNFRLGYNAFSYSRQVKDTDVTYDGNLKLSNASALFDWHPFDGGFRLTFGAVGASNKVEVTGKPAQSTYTIGGMNFASTDVGSLDGKIQFGNSIQPYLGLGWGNTVDQKNRFTVVFDVGAMYAGSADVKLNGQCGSAVANTPVCTMLQSAVTQEETDLKDALSSYKIWPVVSLGLAVRF